MARNLGGRQLSGGTGPRGGGSGGAGGSDASAGRSEPARDGRDGSREAEAAAEEGVGEGERRGRGYDEATRRAKRKKRTEGTAQARYVERRKRMWGGDIKRGIEVGPLTVERVVGARYEWRDAAYAARSGASAVIWLGSQVWDPGR